MIINIDKSSLFSFSSSLLPGSKISVYIILIFIFFLSLPVFFFSSTIETVAVASVMCVCMHVVEKKDDFRSLASTTITSDTTSTTEFFDWGSSKCESIRRKKSKEKKDIRFYTTAAYVSFVECAFYSREREREKKKYDESCQRT